MGMDEVFDGSVGSKGKEEVEASFSSLFLVEVAVEVWVGLERGRERNEVTVDFQAAIVSDADTFGGKGDDAFEKKGTGDSGGVRAVVLDRDDFEAMGRTEAISQSIEPDPVSAVDLKGTVGGSGEEGG